MDTKKTNIGETKMKTTKEESVTDMVGIWAIPRSQYYMEENPNAVPFRYELSTGRNWTTGAVKVYERKK